MQEEGKSTLACRSQSYMSDSDTREKIQLSKGWDRNAQSFYSMGKLRSDTFSSLAIGESQILAFCESENCRHIKRK